MSSPALGSAFRRSLAAVLLAFPLAAQIEQPASHRVAVAIDSSTVANTATDPALHDVAAAVFSRVVTVPNASWVRLSYGAVMLAGDRLGGRGSFLRITSLADGAHQTQHALHVAQWGVTSAYFNGGSVLVELCAFPGTGANRITITSIEAGDPPPVPESICGLVDDRAASNDPRAGRLSMGCTAWLIDDCQHCLLTAGHCGVSATTVLEFNVPLSDASGNIQHPPPSDQYAVDPASVQSNGGQGIGDDYAYFGVFANSTTGLTPVQAQGQYYTLAATPPQVAGQLIRITGYGSTSAPVSPTLYQAQKTHAGPYTSFSNTTLRYATDTTGGNSGSAVVDESTGLAIGIHTHGGCDPANHGTAISHPGLQGLLANPIGVCRCPGLTFTYPNGLPDRISPQGGTTVRVAVGPDGPNTPMANTGELYYDLGAGFVSTPMTQVSPNVYDAVFPAATCGATVPFYFSALATNGMRFDDARRSMFSVAGLTSLADYDFETAPPNWTVTYSGAATGAWVRGVPVGNGGGRGDPPTDYDGSGQCWVTGNLRNDDVDDGPFYLTTETFDLSAAYDPYVSFARWMKNDTADDAFRFEISETGGASWILVEQVIGDTGGWDLRRFRILDWVTGLSRVRFQFSIADNPDDSITEAGVDAFRIDDLSCFAATWREFGAGCTGSAGVPTLTSSDLPVAGQSFTTDIGNIPPGGIAWGVIGFNNTALNWIVPLPIDLGFLGMPGCAIQVDIALSVPLSPLGSVASMTLSLPPDPSVFGMMFYEQAYVLDPLANPFGLTVTNGGAATVGQ